MKFAFSLLLFTTSVYAVGTATTGVQWEVRPGGNDANGGGFNDGVIVACTGGTDYSLSDTPHVTFDGAVITATAAGVGTTLIPTGYTVATTDKCNVLQISGGVNFTVGLYVIIGVNVGTNTWSLDAGVTSGAASAMTGRMGGGFLTPQKGVAQSGASGGGDAVWFKGGTPYAITTTIQPASITTVISTPVTYSGYTTTHGDGGHFAVTSATNSLALWTFGTQRYVVLKNVDFTHTAGTRGNCVTTSGGSVLQSVIQDFTMDGCAIGIDNGTETTNNLLITNGSIINSVSYGFNTAAGFRVYNMKFAGNGGAAVRISAQPAQLASMVMDHNIMYANNRCFEMTVSSQQSTWTFTNNSCANSVSDGIRVNSQSGSSAAMVRNNIIYNNGTGGGTAYGIFVASSFMVPSVNDHNAYGSNLTAALQAWPAGTSDVTLGACNPFTNAAGGDFSLSACGKLALQGLGYPGVIPSAGTGYMSIGALEPQGNTGGSASAYVQ